MSRKPFIAANWKMNILSKDALSFLEELKTKIDYSKKDVIICPSFVLLKTLKDNKDDKMLLGAQNCYFEKDGAFTGEISVDMLKDIGCDYVIIGHSERRNIFKESDEDINKKIKAALETGLKVIFCIGESFEQREMEETFDVLESQVKTGLKGIDSVKEIIIAYEPIWAIGTGKTAYPEQVQEVHEHLRKIVEEIYGSDAKNTRILYGGSVKPNNVKELMSLEDVDGVLVGGASLKADSFEKLINYEEQ